MQVVHIGDAMVVEVQLGDGRYLPTAITRSNGDIGVLFRRLNRARNVGDSASDEFDFQNPVAQHGDVVIWIGTLAAGRIVQDVVNYACLHMRDRERKGDRDVEMVPEFDPQVLDSPQDTADDRIK